MTTISVPVLSHVLERRSTVEWPTRRRADMTTYRRLVQFLEDHELAEAHFSSQPKAVTQQRVQGNGLVDAHVNDIISKNSSMS